MADAPSTTATGIRLVLPTDPQLLRIVRLVASGLASLTELGLDAVEEVRAAADELVAALIEVGDAEVSVAMSIEGGILRLEASTPLRRGAKLDVDPITDQILEKVATSHTWSSADGVAQGVVERDLR